MFGAHISSHSPISQSFVEMNTNYWQSETFGKEIIKQESIAMYINS